MKIAENLEEKGLTLHLSGALDETSSPSLEQKLEEVLSQDVDDIRFDLKSVQYISSAGIRVLIVAYKRAVKSGKRVSIESISSEAEKVLEMVGILQLFNIPGKENA